MRHPEGNLGALAKLAIDVHLAAHQFQDFFNDGDTQARAWNVARLVGAIEAFAYTSQLLRRQPNALVDDLNTQLLPIIMAA